LKRALTQLGVWNQLITSVVGETELVEGRIHSNCGFMKLASGIGMEQQQRNKRPPLVMVQLSGHKSLDSPIELEA